MVMAGGLEYFPAVGVGAVGLDEAAGPAEHPNSERSKMALTANNGLNKMNLLEN
jgi:hypothetical protein